METKSPGWLRVVLMILAAEKIVQHTVVTAALSFNWKDINSTVAVPPAVLIALGVPVTILFATALWGLIKRRGWAVNLIMALAIFDMLGEFAAQGTISIQLNVSFLVASVLFMLCLLERRAGGEVKQVSSTRG